MLFCVAVIKRVRCVVIAIVCAFWRCFSLCIVCVTLAFARFCFALVFCMFASLFVVCLFCVVINLLMAFLNLPLAESIRKPYGEGALRRWLSALLLLLLLLLLLYDYENRFFICLNVLYGCFV